MSFKFELETKEASFHKVKIAFDCVFQIYHAEDICFSKFDIQSDQDDLVLSLYTVDKAPYQARVHAGALLCPNLSVAQTSFIIGGSA